MTSSLSISWPLKNAEEAALLAQCEALSQTGSTEALQLDCVNVLYPSTRFLTLLLDIASLAPQQSSAWTLLNIKPSVAEALWLTGLDRWFLTGQKTEELQ